MPRGYPITEEKAKMIAFTADMEGSKIAAFRHGVSRKTVFNCCKKAGISLYKPKPVKVRPHDGPHVVLMRVLRDLIINQLDDDGIMRKHNITPRRLRGIKLSAKAGGLIW